MTIVAFLISTVAEPNETNIFLAGVVLGVVMALVMFWLLHR